MRVLWASAQAEDSLPEACHLPHQGTCHHLTVSSCGNGHGEGWGQGRGRQGGSWEKGQLPEAEEGSWPRLTQMSLLWDP